MTPSNNPNGEPLIYRICDAAGVFHLVAPVNHTHTYQDVPGLAGELNELWSGLNEKANAEDVTKALAGKANAIGGGSPSGGIVVANTAGELIRSPKTITDLENAIAAKQDALTFDTTPTANSTNPVTSGGVKAALDGKTGISRGNNGWVEVKENGEVEIIGDQSVFIGISDMNGVSVTLDNIANLKRALLNPDPTPAANSNNLVTSGGVWVAIQERFQGIVPDVITLGEGDSMRLDELGMTPPSVRRFIIQNNSSSSVPFRDMFESASLPVHISGDETLEVGSNEYVMVSIFRENSSEHVHFNCYFVLLEGIFSE